MDQEDFDIEKFTSDLTETHPELMTEGLEGTSDNEFEPDNFERKMFEEFPEIAGKICELDEQTVKEAQQKTVSKKQQTRDRQQRLDGMMLEGRSVTEKSDPTFHDKILKIEGPMELLAKSVIEQRRMEIRTRSVMRIDRIFKGIPTTFDEHFNIMMRDVTETILHGRKSKKDVGSRNRLQSLLPEFLRWKEGGDWPMPIGANCLLEHRFQRSCFIKGDSVVLLRLLP